MKVFAVTDTSAIEKALEEAVKKGDVAEAKKQIAKLKEATAPKGYPVFEVPVPPMPPGVAFVPTAPLAPLPPGAPIPPAAAAGASPPRTPNSPPIERNSPANERNSSPSGAKMESKIDALKKAAEELKDQPEAKAALEKTIEAYTKQLAEAKKKFEEQAPRNMAWGYGFGQGAQPLAPEAMKNVMDQMTKVYEEQIKKLDDPKAKAAVQEAMKASKAAMEKMQKQLNQSGMLEFRTPQGQAFSFQPLDAAGEGFAKGAATFRAIAAPKGGRFGITFEPLPTTTAELLDLPVGKGVIVLSVADGSPAAKAGVKKNDIILEVAGKAVTNTDEIVKMVGEMKADKAFDVVVVRKGKTETIKGITLPEVKVTENAPKAATETKNSSTSLTTTINDNKVVRILASKDGVSYTIQGTIQDGKIVPTSITVRKGGSDKKGKQTETTVAKLSELSAEDQEAVKDFLSKVNVSTK